MLRRDLRILAAAVLAAVPGSPRVSLAQGSPRTSPAITVADLRSRLFRIADDSMLGRETGSKGAFQTADYVAAEFARLGLRPAGEQGGWFQAVPFWVLNSDVRLAGAFVGRTVDGSRPGALVSGTDFVVIPRAVRATLDGEIATIAGGALDDPAHWIDSAAAAGKLVVIAGSDSAVGQRLTPMLNRAFASPLGLLVRGAWPSSSSTGFRTTLRSTSGARG